MELTLTKDDAGWTAEVKPLAWSRFGASLTEALKELRADAAQAIVTLAGAGEDLLSPKGKRRLALVRELDEVMRELLP